MEIGKGQNLSKYTIKDIQDRLLLIIQDFDTFCRNNKLTYFLMGGSAIGAMRHKGFIPWDDDIDVFMPYEDYNRFLKIYKNSDRYFLQKQNTKSWPLFLSQIRENNTTCISDEWKLNKKMHHGIFIDIMCLYSAPENDIKRYLQYSAAMLLKTNALYKSKYPAKGIVKRSLLLLSSFFVNSFTRPHIYKYVTQYSDKDVNYVGHFFGRARFKHSSFPKEFLGNPRLVPFEDIELPVMEHVEKYLNVRYGTNWHKMPDQKTKDQYPQHAGFVDLNKHFTNYI